MKLENKSVIVTGSAGGIGEAIARLFAKEGANIILADCNEEGVKKVADELNELRRNSAIALKVDVSKKEDTDHMIDVTLEKFGSLDILVNNAGIMDGFEPIGDISDAKWQKVMDVNVLGVMRSIRRAIPIFKEQKSGVIINIASIGGLYGARAGVAYTASKHALVGLTKNTAFMYAKENIRCNAIAPGGVATNIAESMGDINQFGMEKTQPGLALSPSFGQPKDIAEVALFLASAESNFVNGTVLTADAGWSAY
jgi:NAD(P)-dependent dehydrogenase (short-subunit alcohol dehydrogenase family)